MELKKVQEVWDKCNFTEEQKKLFPRPETEEDLKDFEKMIFTNTHYQCNGLCIFAFILFMIFGFGGWGPIDFLDRQKIDNPES